MQALCLNRIDPVDLLSNSDLGRHSTSAVSFEKEYEGPWETREQWKSVYCR
jgi:hypothetical protein